jgi:hypothetical protein
MVRFEHMLWWVGLEQKAIDALFVTIEYLLFGYLLPGGDYGFTMLSLFIWQLIM